PSTISSTIAATLGTHSSTNPGRLCPSRDATGQQSVTQSEDWYYSAIADSTPAEWQAMVGVNLIGVANYCKAALPALRRSGRASIVNVSSCYALTGRKGMGLYDATKAGILAITRTLAFEEVAHGVRVNAVCPGSTLTDFHIAKAKAAGKS